MKQKNLVLMVVAVGCGLGAAFLTSQMSAKQPPPVEQVEVLVASKDLPAMTLITAEDLPKVTRRKAFPKAAVPPRVVDVDSDLVGKRLGRGLAADEPFNPADLVKGLIDPPPGYDTYTLPIGAVQAVAGFVSPGCRVDVLGTVRLRNQIRVLPILVNMLVLAVDTKTQYPKEGAFLTVNTVSFAVDRKQALLIKLAQARSCDMSLLLRNPDEASNELDKQYKIDTVIKLLQDEESKAEVADGEGRSRKAEPQPELAPPPTPRPETVRVPVAAADLPPGTPLTADLLADPKAFAARELPKEVAADAVADYGPYLGQTLRTGLGKGQWATPGLIGPAAPKGVVKDEFAPPKEPPAPPPAAKEPPKPAPKPAPRPTHDVALHTPSGSKVFRYEEVRPGEWRLLGEVRPTAPAPAAMPPAEAAKPDAPKPDAPKPDRRID